MVTATKLGPGRGSFQCPQQVRDRPSKTIKAPHDNGVKFPPAGVRHQSIELWTLLLGSGDPQVYVFAYAAPRSIRSSQTNWLRLALLMESGSSRARHFKGGNFRQSLGAKKLSQPLYAVHVVSVGTWV